MSVVGRFERGRIVFYGDGGALAEQPIPDQRAVMVDVPPGAVSVVVVAPVWVPFRSRNRWWQRARRLAAS